ncbi:SDR family NAD(P)-dependent oxidoreductase [Algoriphagus lacus]|uniref:SDR family NAD(P)-dependent oxidoreductase n=2 Tax=Algoriphagus lacus TaxID=2056311 RepID=A0A418PXA0_9BACT|nr:SDR family NAD(P)-dependent oxidoreductase [Algoriphagus lacus]
MGMNSFENKRIIVTGAASGIGLEMVRQLIPFTKEILAVDNSVENLQKLQSQFPEVRHLLKVDLSEKSGNELILTWVKTHWTHVDFCFANAGKAIYSPALCQSGEELERLIQLNLTSPIDLGFALLDKAPKGKFRHVITASAMSYWSLPGYSAYSASKAGLLSWAEAVWAEKKGNWLSLAFPIATKTKFFDAAGKGIPAAFPIQNPDIVSRKILLGASIGKKKIFPSRLFRLMLTLDRFLPIIRPIYLAIEYSKYSKWLTKHSKT